MGKELIPEDILDKYDKNLQEFEFLNLDGFRSQSRVRQQADQSYWHSLYIGFH